jgi:hypothetical protein
MRRHHASRTALRLPLSPSPNAETGEAKSQEQQRGWFRNWRCFKLRDQTQRIGIDNIRKDVSARSFVRKFGRIELDGAAATGVNNVQ